MLGSSTGIEPEGGAQRHRLGVTQPEQRLGRTWLHRRQPVRPGAAQQVDQDRFGLVVSGVPGEDVGGQHRRPGGAGPCLEVGARLDVHGPAFERHADA